MISVGPEHLHESLMPVATSTFMEQKSDIINKVSITD